MMRAPLPAMRLGAVLLALAGAAPTRADPMLGRLFSTPAERAALEARRGDGAGAGAIGGVNNVNNVNSNVMSGAMPIKGGPAIVYNGGMPMKGGVSPVLSAPPSDPNAAPADAPATPPPAETLVLNGVLRSSGGRSTIWLNDQPQRAGQAAYAKPARNGNGMTVMLPSGQRVLLKPGQRYDLNEGKVKDVNEP